MKQAETSGQGSRASSQFVATSLLFGAIIFINIGVSPDSFLLFKERALGWVWLILFPIIAGGLFFSALLAICKSTAIVLWLQKVSQMHWLFKFLFLMILMGIPMLLSVKIADVLLGAVVAMLG